MKNLIIFILVALTAATTCTSCAHHKIFKGAGPVIFGHTTKDSTVNVIYYGGNYKHFKDRKDRAERKRKEALQLAAPVVKNK